MSIPAATRLEMVSMLVPETNQWTKWTPTVDFGLSIAGYVSQQVRGETKLSVFICGSILIKHSPPTHSLKVYTRGRDMSLKYWDEGGPVPAWKKVQVTFETVVAMQMWASFFYEVGVEVVDKDKNKNLNNGVIFVDLANMSDEEFRRLMLEKLNNLEFQKLLERIYKLV